MFGLKYATCLVAALAFHQAIAQTAPYQTFYIQGIAQTLAGPLEILETQTSVGSFEVCIDFCNSRDDCLGFTAGKLETRMPK